MGVATAEIGLVGLAVMGQNLALNVAEKGFTISVFNRSYEKTELAVARAKKEGLDERLKGYKELKDFVQSLKKPRRIILLVKAGTAVDATIDTLVPLLEEGDQIIDGGNEWYENTERRAKAVATKGLGYLGMGVSGGEEGARNGPSMMPGGSKDGYEAIQKIVEKVAAQVDDGPCVTYIGPGGSGNFVKQVHNGIEYGDMQLISEAYDLLKTVGGLTNEEMVVAFNEWNKSELDSFLIQISAEILAFKDPNGSGFLVDRILDKTGMKGTGKWTVQQAAELAIAAPTIEAALDGRFLSGLKDERVAAAKFFDSQGLKAPTPAEGVNKKELVEIVKHALYASKICSYAQGLNIIKAKSEELGWNVDLGEISRIWKGGCIIRAGFLNDIKAAYKRDGNLKNLLVDPFFASQLVEREQSWRKVICLAVTNGVAVPGMTASLAYFDTYRRERLPANLVQAQRDYFGSHTYQLVDGDDSWHHTVWSEKNSADSITTSTYIA
jgi:6-phosphogluconate dehydrogenase